MGSARRRATVASLAVSFFAAHALNHARLGHPFDALWACHVATLLVGAAAWRESPRLNAVALVLLALGNLLWLIDLLFTGDWMWTSLLTHVGALALALGSARRLGYPRGSWWRALLVIVGWQQLTRLLTPPARNINMAFAVHPSSTSVFSSYPAYWLAMTALCALLMAASEAAYRRLFAAPAAQ